jgi:DNA-directed RNA polymerase subunit M/transcription elongation factor TFIIS
MKVYCTVCSNLWEASKYVIESSYICPKCTSRMRHNKKINLGGKKNKNRTNRRRRP